MYRKILVALENGPADESLVPHVTELAKQLHSQLLLVHVADGWAARHYDQFKLADSEEMIADRAYLEQVASRLRESGLQVETKLVLGNPPDEIVKTSETEHCDLIAMTTHGHRLLGDLIHGSTISLVRHKSLVPLLVVHAVHR
ncbi:MAG: universal stress protein [Candidatus Omnitrophica bacterium]|nr:universal stress protein [Candidatus Omnitrophota bacterium]